VDRVYRLPIGTILTIEQCESAPDGILGLKSVPFRLDGGSGDNFYKHFFFSVSMANIAAWACRTTNLVLRLSWRTQAPQCEIGTFETNIKVNMPPFPDVSNQTCPATWIRRRGSDKCRGLAQGTYKDTAGDTKQARQNRGESIL